MMQRARQLLHAAVTTLARLSPREQRLVGLFFVIAAAGGFYVLVVEPVSAARSRMERRIETLDRDLVAMHALARRLSSLDAQIGDGSTAGDVAEDFSLFSFMDRATSASVNPDAVAAMNPTRRQVREGIEESAVEIRLTTVSLSEVVGLLRKIEQAAQPVYVKRVELKRRYDDRTRFDAIVVAGAISRT